MKPKKKSKSRSVTGFFDEAEDTRIFKEMDDAKKRGYFQWVMDIWKKNEKGWRASGSLQGLLKGMLTALEHVLQVEDQTAKRLNALEKRLKLYEAHDAFCQATERRVVKLEKGNPRLDVYDAIDDLFARIRRLEDRPQMISIPKEIPRKKPKTGRKPIRAKCPTCKSRGFHRNGCIELVR